MGDFGYDDCFPLLSLLGLFGNQPFLTLSLCLNTSIIDQKDENEVTPSNMDAIVFVISRDNNRIAIHKNRKSHQHFTTI